MTITKQIETAIRSNFRGPANKTVRQEIRDKILCGIDPILLNRKIAFSYTGQAGLEEISLMFRAESTSRQYYGQV